MSFVIKMFKWIWQKEYDENKYLLDVLRNENIKKRTASNLQWFIKKAIETKYGYYMLTAITIIAPVVSGIVLNAPFSLENLIFLSSIILGISTVAAAMIPLLNWHKKWILYRNQAESIKHILAKAYADGKLDEKEILEEIEENMSLVDKKWTMEQKKQR